MCDCSDGLGIDLDRLAEASGVGVHLDVVPCAEGATEEDALGVGDDYELLFFAPDEPQVHRAFEAAGLRRPIVVGYATADREERSLGSGSFSAIGWRHR
jgi:thiamine monophosphate kinase